MECTWAPPAPLCPGEPPAAPAAASGTVESVKQHRAALIVLVVAAAVGCLALGWWQWTRFESAGGTAQNLGYALQWPLFAGFVIYAYRRFVQLEDTGPAVSSESAPPTEIPAGLLPPRPAAAADPGTTMTEYNRYLAGLAAQDRQDARDNRRD